MPNQNPFINFYLSTPKKEHHNWYITLSNIKMENKTSLFIRDYESYEQAKKIYDDVLKNRIFGSTNALPADDEPKIISMWQEG